ncbi:MAG: FAD-dependent oxidoreductase [Christensenellales bacterium]|jgi:hypothetical protein
MDDNHTLLEHSRIPIQQHFNVVVAGGGVAGVAAAMAAARMGKSVLLLEKMILLGGLATAGFVVIYLPLCDGRGRKLIGGISEEMLLASIEHSYDTLPDIWRNSPKFVDTTTQRYQTLFNGPLFAMRLDELLLASGAKLLLDTRVCTVVHEGRRVTHIIIENADGRSAIPCDTVVDATGDAVIFKRMGALTTDGANYMSYWAYRTSMEKIYTATESGRIQDAIQLYTGAADCNGKGQPTDLPPFRGITADNVTRMALYGRSAALQYLRSQPAGQVAFTGIPSMPQFRTTRMIVGDEPLSFEQDGKRCETSIGACGDWRGTGVTLEIPYGALTSPDVDNVLAAGRIIASADREAWEVARVIPVAAQTGEAAGIAAALAGCSKVHDVAPSAIADCMQRAGHVIHL